MKKVNKIQGIAIVNNVEIPESLAESNEANERLDVKVTFTYKEVAERAEKVNEQLNGLSDKVLALASKASRNNTFTYLLDATRLGYDHEKDADKALNEISDILKGKECVFTTYIVPIEVLLRGSIYEKLDEDTVTTAVHTDTRAYTSFNSSFLLVNDDEEAVIDSMSARIVKQLADDKYTVGRTDEEAKQWKAYRKSLKASKE